MTKTNNELDIVLPIVRKASEEIRRIYYGASALNIETKSNNTPVTNADKLANDILVRSLQEAFPGDGIVSEEDESVAGTTGNDWYIDPIDGTKGFIKRTDHFAIHVGKSDNKGDPIFGLIYKPTSNEFYFAAAGKGAYRVGPNGVEIPLVVNKTPTDKLTLVVNRSFSRLNPGLIEKLMPGRDQLVTGGAGLRILKVVENAADVFMHSGEEYNTWDLNAPHAIAKEAGAYVSDINDKKLVYHGQRIIGGQFVAARTEDLGKYVAREFKKYKES